MEDKIFYNEASAQSLGWEPKCNFDDELSEIVEFYKENFIW